MILKKIEDKTRERIEEIMKIKSLEKIKKEAYEYQGKEAFRFEKALSQEKLAFICEVKKASPSKGVIAQDFPYIEIAKEYEAAGANAISVLTEPHFFMGSDEFLKEISKNVSIPLLRKDFTINEYMIYEAKLMGADAILLICAILSQEQLNEYQKIAHSLGLSVLVEAHDEKEVMMALESSARIIGVNNRDLKTFTVDINNSINLSKLIPKEVIFVSESGIQTKEDVERLKAGNVDALLIGETFMRSDNKKAMITSLRGDM